MRTEPKYRHIDRELDNIILAEINFRINKQNQRKKPETVFTNIEERIDNIVQYHQRKTIEKNIPALFSNILQIREDGKLFFDKNDIDSETYQIYTGKKDRLNALVSGALNVLAEEDLIALVYNKVRTFDDKHQLSKHLMTLAAEVENIRKKADDPGLVSPRDEEDALAYLEEIAPLKARLQSIEVTCNEHAKSFYVRDAVKKLQNEINLAQKSINKKGQKASKLLFDQVASIFQNFKSTRMDIINIDTFIQQKDELKRFQNLFASLGERTREKQTADYIAAIESTVESLHKTIEKQKQEEAFVSEKSQREVAGTYALFLEIKQKYADGAFDDNDKRQKTLKRLKKLQDTFRSHGQQLKAREVERFINSTGIAVPIDDPHESLRSELRFYKKGFFILLLLTIGLLFLCGVLVF